MNVKRVTIHNVMGVKDIDMSLAGHNLFLIGGRNGQGKSSAIRALIMALCGRSGCDFPEEPLRRGEDEGWVRIEMDGDKEMFQNQLIIERRFERREDGTVREKIRMIGDNGFEAPTPQKLLQTLYKTRGIDPSAFLQMSEAEQAKELQRIVGIDTSEIEAKRAKAYEERTAVNREIKNLEARVKSSEHFADAPDQPVSVVALMAERRNVEAANAEIDRKLKSVEKLVTDAESWKREAEAKIQRADMKAQERDRIEKQIEKLRQDQERLSQEINDVRVEANTLLAEHASQINTAAAEREAIPPKLSTDQIDESIKNAESINEKVRANQSRARLIAELDEKKAQSESLSQRVKDADRERLEMIENADWPIDHLRFENGRCMFHGIALKDCSTAEQTTVSTVMSMAMSPKLKLLTIQRGESMDDETLQIVADLAESKGYQVLVERVTRNEDEDRECQVVFEDGIAKG